jgi:hypothetical protein
MTQKTVPLRVRVTEPEAQKYRRAMQALGLTEISTFVRWALDNSSEAVLRGGVRPQAPTPPPEPVRMSRMPAPAAPAPAPGPVPTLADVLGVPLYGSGPRPVDAVDGDDWT